MACSTGCKTQDHATYGECMRSKRPRAGAPWTAAQKKADKNLDNYAEARKYGVQPASTRKRDVDRAIQISDQTGTAFQA